MTIVANIKDIIGLLVLALCTLILIGIYATILIASAIEKIKQKRKEKNDAKIHRDR